MIKKETLLIERLFLISSWCKSAPCGVLAAGFTAEDSGVSEFCIGN